MLAAFLVILLTGCKVEMEVDLEKLKEMSAVCENNGGVDYFRLYYSETQSRFIKVVCNNGVYFQKRYHNKETQK